MLRNILGRVIPRSIYRPFHKKIFLLNLSRKMKKIREKYDYAVVLIATPLHGNLGDHAIVYAQLKFLEDKGFQGRIVEIPSHYYQMYTHEIEKIISNEDAIIIDGGGSMGTLWIEVEHKMQDIVQRFPNNRIFIFPQTIFYSNDKYGEIELEKSKEVYSRHQNLVMCAREKKSHQFMKEQYPEIKVLLTPDIVLYLPGIKSVYDRNGAMFCLREDKEKVLDNGIVNSLVGKLYDRKMKVSYNSTVIPQRVSYRNRLKKLNELWNSFAKAEIVITDRLHGMIFAVITGTPCIAFDNSSGKVANVYEWIKDIEYIHLCNNPDEDLDEVLDLLTRKENKSYDNRLIKTYFEELSELFTSSNKV